MNRKWRLYLDTSVFGGCFDTAEGWSRHSQRIIDAALLGIVTICVSDTVIRELESAPFRVRELWNNLLPESRELIPITPEIESLSAAYIETGIVGRNCLDDALHVAAATVIRVDAIVSWNFKHIVRFDRIKAYNQVNISLGYGIMTIVSPEEVSFDE